MLNTKKIILLIIFFTIFFILFMPFLNNPLFFDDQYFFVKNFPEKFLEDGFKLKPRWWVYETLAVTYVELSHKVFWLRAGNIVLQLAVVWALIIFIHDIISNTDRSIGKNLSIKSASCFAGLFFLIHPIATLTYGYLIQRTILCATLFALLSLIAFLRGISGKTSWLILSCAFFVIAVYAKEHVVMLPFVTILLTLLTIQSKQNFSINLHKVALTIIVQILVAAFVIFQTRWLIGSSYEPNINETLQIQTNIDQNMLYPLSILNQASLFFRYLALWILPVPSLISLDLRTPFPLHIFEASNIIGILAFFVYILLGFYFLLRGRIMGLIGFSMLAPAVLYLTEFSTVRIQEPFVLYRSYLWAVFLFIPLAIAIRTINSRLAIIISLTFIIFFTALSFLRLKTYSHPVFVWQEAADIYEKNKDKKGIFGGYRIFYNLGTELKELGFIDSSIKALTRAVELNPKYGWSWNNRGAAYLSKGDYPSAQADFEIAIKLLPGEIMPWKGVAKIFKETKNQKELFRAQKILCALEGNSECATFKE